MAQRRMSRAAGVVRAVLFVAAFAVPLVWVVGAAPGSERLEVYPQPGTRTANPATTISLRGLDDATVSDLQASGLEVSGSDSGERDGAVRAHRDGQGLTFKPDEPFTPGEWVTVRADDDQAVFRIGVPGDIPDRQDRSDGIAEASPDTTTFVSEPSITAPVVTTSGEPVPDLLLTTPGPTTTTPASAMITDGSGELVWWRGSSDAELSFGNLIAAQHDGRPVLAWYEGADPDGPGWYEGEWVVVDEAYREVLRIPAANGMLADLHDVELTDRGTAWLMAYHPVVEDMSAHGGGSDTIVVEGVLQEVDLATGDVWFEWHSLDHVPVEWGVVPIRDDDVFDYFHVNSLVESPDGDLLVTARHTSMVAEIDRDTGALDWVLGGPGATVDVGDDRGISFPHHARWRDDGALSIFDNGVGFDPPTSRGVVYELDEGRRRARVLQEYQADPPRYTPTQGSLQHLDDGRVLAAWTEERTLSLFGNDGTPVGAVDGGAPADRAGSAAGGGVPAEPPAVGIEDGAVHASWNGATEVAEWELLVGDDGSDLQPVGRTPTTGFETQVGDVAPGQAAAVRALAASGEVLGVSDPVRDERPAE